MEQENPIILSLYPDSRGIGYVCLQVPKGLYDYGITTAKPISNRRLLKRTEKFIDHFKPKIVVLREQAKETNSDRNNKLIDAIVTLAGEKELQVFRYSKQQIRDVFEVFGASTKFGIVEQILKTFPDLAYRAPKQKKWYEREDYNMTLFNAVALALTHVYLSE